VTVAEGTPERIAICRICQMRLPERLVTFGPNTRGGIGAVCAADASLAGLPVDEAKRAEVIALRRQYVR
jgi:hypothetical protein